MIRAADIRTVVASPYSGLVYVSASLWNNATEAFRNRHGPPHLRPAPTRSQQWDDFVLAETLPDQWAEVLRVFPDAGKLSPGEHMDTRGVPS